MASIKRRRGKYHVVYYYLNECGEKKQKWESFDTEAEAKHRKAEIEYKQGNRTFISPNKTTVSAFLDGFVSSYNVTILFDSKCFFKIIACLYAPPIPLSE